MNTKIWALKKVKAIHPIVKNTVKSLAILDIIKFIRITGNFKGPRIDLIASF
jgi:hypothetical protein